MPLVGAHMSIAGGLHLAFEQISKIEGQALQIFTRNQRQWRAKPLTAEEIEPFRQARSAWGDYPIASHDSYLINLASPKEETRIKSLAAFTDELNRCGQLDIPYVIMHPGSHLGEGVEAGIATFTANLDRALADADQADRVKVLIETTAGQGTGLGSSFAEIASIIEASRFADRLGVCLDTCHIFAAGYDIRSPAAYAATMAEFDRTIGLERLLFFHLNDSIKPLGSRVDRHDHIGAGAIGLAGFRNLITDPRFARHPMVLETPKGPDLQEDIDNLARLLAMLA